MIKYKLWWDRLGIALSVVCLVHCLLLPFAVAAIPLLAAPWLESNGVHIAMAVLLLPVALLAVIPGLRVHGRKSVAAAMLAGLSLISTAAFAGEALLTREWEIGLTVLGGAILVCAHAVNLLLCRTCPACTTHDHAHDHHGAGHA